MYCSTTLDLNWRGKVTHGHRKLYYCEAQVVVWSSAPDTVQAIWCHDISVAWVRIPAREEQKNCWWSDGWIWCSGTAAVQAIWCHDITVAWVRIPAREEPKNLRKQIYRSNIVGLMFRRVVYIYIWFEPMLLWYRDTKSPALQPSR